MYIMHALLLDSLTLGRSEERVQSHFLSSPRHSQTTEKTIRTACNHTYTVCNYNHRLYKVY